MSNDPLSREISSGGNTPGSDEERIEQDDLTDFVPPTPHDSPLSGGHTPGSDDEAKGKNSRDETLQDWYLQENLDEEYVSKQGRKSDKTKTMFDDSDFAEPNVDNAMENVEGDAKTQGRNTAEQITTAWDTINTTSIDVSVAGPSNVSTADPSTSTVGDIFEDEMMNIADTLRAIRSTRPRKTLVVIRDVEEEPRRATLVPIVQSQDKGKSKMVEPKPTPKNPIKAQIQRDAEIAKRLHEEEKAELERMQRERVAQEEASNAALIAEFDNVQARIEADAMLAARLQEKEREQFSIDEQARFLVETITERKRFFAAQIAEQIRNIPTTKIQLRNKMITYLKTWDFIPMDSEEGGKKAASSKKRPRAEPDEESVKIQKIGETSGSGEEQSAEKEKELSEEELHKLLVVVPVEEVYVEALQVELKRLFELDNDDILWKLKRYMHDPLVWRLYDTCGVHHVSSIRGHDTFMLVEKEYPLSKGVLMLMLVNK
ncbi:hypothetical protein Tco_0548948 [Tanacetum coccineum]